MMKLYRPSASDVAPRSSDSMRTRAPRTGRGAADTWPVMVIVVCAAAGTAQIPRNRRARTVKPRRRRVICELNLESNAGSAGHAAWCRMAMVRNYRAAIFGLRTGDAQDNEARLRAKGHGGRAVAQLARSVATPAQHGTAQRIAAGMLVAC